MSKKRLIACFDIVNGMVTKGGQFKDNINVAPAEELAVVICADKIDELIFFDIFASAEKRPIDIETVKKVAKNVTVPFMVGGGLRNIDDMGEAINAGADKVSVDSMAVRNPQIIADGAKAFGSEHIVLSTQVRSGAATPSGYEVYIDAAKTATGMDAIEWIKKGEAMGAGEICINSIDQDGMHKGYDITLMKLAGNAVKVPLIASGGAGAPEHLLEVFTQTNSQGAIISSMLYSPRLERNYTVSELKTYLSDNNVAVIQVS